MNTDKDNYNNAKDDNDIDMQMSLPEFHRLKPEGY